MEAILLVGGLGTRLRPLTDDLPKPMLPVGGVPLVVHQIARAREVGVDHVVLATSYRAEVFADALGEGTDVGVRVDYAVEEEPLGTGGAIRNAACHLSAAAGEPVLVFNGDIVDGHDLPAQLKAHADARADVSLYLTRVDDPRAFGCVPTDGRGMVTAFMEKTLQPVTDQINAGCYVFRRSVIDAIPTGRAVSVERETFPALLAAHAVVVGIVDDAYWRDLGTAKAYVRGSADVVLGRVDAPARPGPAGPALVLAGAVVIGDAHLSGGTSVSAGCRVGAGSTVHGSVLMDGARIGDGAVVRSSAVGRGARIGTGAVVDRAVVAAGAAIGPGERLGPAWQ